jgi:hypothetical protein
MLQIAVKSEIAKVMTAISPSSRDAKLMMQAELAATKGGPGAASTFSKSSTGSIRSSFRGS